jgi:uncharacterized protein YrzB (UPF0473 family)
MDEERDFVVFTDEDGNEFELDVITYFDYNDNEYAILADLNGEEGDEEEEEGLYIMRIIVSEDGQTEEFVPPEDEDMDALVELAEKVLSEDCCCCDDDCDCEDGDCGCEEHEHDCHCGCKHE